MHPSDKRTRFSAGLGVALLLQAVTSLVSGSLFLGPFTDKSDILGVIQSTAAAVPMARVATLIDVVTALTIIWLAVMFYRLTRDTHPVLSTLALALYVTEAGILLLSKAFAFGFIQASILAAGQPGETGVFVARTLLSLKDICYTLHMIPCGVGAVLFYALIARNGALPKWLPLWGLIAIIPVWISSILKLLGIELPIYVTLPYAPFEFFAAIYILIRGLATPNVAPREAFESSNNLS